MINFNSIRLFLSTKDNIIFLLLLCFFAVLPLYSNITDSIAFIVLLLWISQICLGENRLEKGRITTVVLLLTGALSISFIFNIHNVLPQTIDKFFPFQHLLRFIAPFIWYLIISSVSLSKPRIKTLVFVILISFLMWLAYFSFEQLRISFFSLSNRFTFLTNPNFISDYIAIICILIFSFFYYEEKIQLKVLDLIALVFCVIFLFFTYTRGAWIGLAAGLFLLGAILRNKKYLLTLLILFGVSILLFLFTPGLIERFQSIVSTSDTSNNMRLSFWKGAIQLLRQLPWFSLGPNKLFGIGIDMFHHYFSVLNIPVDLKMNTHQIFLQIFTEFGLISEMAFIIFIVFIFTELLALLKKERTKFNMILQLAVIGSLVVLVVHGFTEVNFFFQPNMYLFMSLLAFCVRLSNNEHVLINSDIKKQKY